MLGFYYYAHTHAIRARARILKFPSIVHYQLRSRATTVARVSAFGLSLSKYKLSKNKIN